MKDLNCCKCGTKFAIEDSIHAARMQDGEVFTCPNGHEQYFSPSENDKLKKEIERLNALVIRIGKFKDEWVGRFHSTDRSLRATKGVVTKLKMKLYPERY